MDNKLNHQKKALSLPKIKTATQVDSPQSKPLK